MNRRDFASQFLVGKSAPYDVPHDAYEALKIVHGPIVESECPLVNIPEQMKGINAHIGFFETAFQQAPKILKPVGVNVAFHVG
jgi:hypothetical protein